MGSIDRFLFILERRKRIKVVNNATSARPPRTQPTMIPTFLLDAVLVDECPEVDGVLLSGSSVLG